MIRTDKLPKKAIGRVWCGGVGGGWIPFWKCEHNRSGDLVFHRKSETLVLPEQVPDYSSDGKLLGVKDLPIRWFPTMEGEEEDGPPQIAGPRKKMIRTAKGGTT